MIQERDNTPRSRKKGNKESHKKLKIGIAAGIVVSLLGISAGTAFAYVQMGQKYKTVFFPNTTINSIDASGRTVDEVKQMIASEIDGYTLTIKERGDKSETITKEEIGLQSVFDGSIEKILGEQNPNKWWSHRKTPSNFEIDTMIQYDETQFQKKLGTLEALDEAGMTAPEDARISDYTSGQGYQVVPSIQGNTLDKEETAKKISEAIMNMQPELVLEDLGVYKAPQITEENEKLIQTAADLNKYAGVTVTYKFGGSTETLNGDRISQWLSVGEDGQVNLDSGSVSAYVKELATKYDTYKSGKSFKTSYGPTIKTSGGSYGWKMNQGAESDELAQIIRSGEGQSREPVYSQTAASRGSNDIGDTYVEINLTAQHIYFYKNGSLVVQSDFVSGNESKGWSTPAGVFSLTYKQRNATLKGEGYATPVDYWMPFNGGIGLHDANWRSTFGGSIYKTSGSHGCVNLPPSVAKTIYENIPSKCPVVAYHLDGTGSGKSTAAPKDPEASKPTETTKAPETTAAPPETTAPKPAETVAPQPTEPSKPPVETSVAPPNSTPETTKAPESSGGPAGPGGPNVGETKAYGPGMN